MNFYRQLKFSIPGHGAVVCLVDSPRVQRTTGRWTTSPPRDSCPPKQAAILLSNWVFWKPLKIWNWWKRGKIFQAEAYAIYCQSGNECRDKKCRLRGARMVHRETKINKKKRIKNSNMYRSK